MKRIVQASAVLVGLLVSFGCDHRSNGPDRSGEVAQSDPGAANPQPGTGLYDAGLLPTPGTSPRPTDPSIGPSESPTMPTNPGTDPAQGYPSTPDQNPGGDPGSGSTP